MNDNPRGLMPDDSRGGLWWGVYDNPEELLMCQHGFVRPIAFFTTEAQARSWARSWGDMANGGRSGLVFRTMIDSDASRAREELDAAVDDH